MRRLLLLAALLSTGCLNFKKVGLAKDPISVQEKVPLVCLDSNGRTGGGREALLTEGALQGRPAIAVDGVLNIGFSYSFTEAASVDGQTVYVGQECLPRYDGVVCDRGLYVRRGDRRFFVYWAAVEMTSDAAAQKAITDATPAEMLERPEVKRLVTKLMALDLDDTTTKALAELSHARNVRKKWTAVKFFSGVALQQLGPAVNSKIVSDAGKQATDSATSPEVDESELALIAANPKLADLFLLDGFGTVCVGPLQYPK
jgi:hypothetical protein